MIAFAGIDGTGPDSNKKYALDFAESHVRRLYKSWPWPELAFYSRGPTTLGMETGVLAQEAYGWVRRLFKSGKAKGIFLAGFSRGGAAVVETAAYLNSFIGTTYTVNCLALFDAVDRSSEVGLFVPRGFSPTTAGAATAASGAGALLGAAVAAVGMTFDTPVGGNVELCLHAFRAKESKSRGSFGNCGLTILRPAKTKGKVKHFRCTHGGVGGTPWKTEGGQKPTDFIDEGFPDGKTAVTFEQDALISKEVWKWLKPQWDAAIEKTKGAIQGAAAKKAG
jgi:hypothetical protein